MGMYGCFFELADFPGKISSSYGLVVRIFFRKIGQYCQRPRPQLNLNPKP